MGAVFVAVAGNLDGVTNAGPPETARVPARRHAWPVIGGLINAAGGCGRWSYTANLQPFDFWLESHDAKQSR
jgi:hypothetical protein